MCLFLDCIYECVATADFGLGCEEEWMNGSGKEIMCFVASVGRRVVGMGVYLKHLFDVMYLMYCSAEFMPVTKFDIS
jgi:hypothetical protein